MLLDPFSPVLDCSVTYDPPPSTSACNCPAPQYVDSDAARACICPRLLDTDFAPTPLATTIDDKDPNTCNAKDNLHHASPPDFVGGGDQPQVAANPNAPTKSWRKSDDAGDNNDEGDDGDGKGERIEDAGSAESASLYTDFIDKHARACNSNNNSSSHDIMDRNNPPPWLTPHTHGLKLATTVTTTVVPQLCMCHNIPTVAAFLTSASTARVMLPLDKRLLFGMYEAIR
jgi:hypothetical protein